MKKYQYFHEVYAKELKKRGALAVRASVADEIMREFKAAGYFVKGGAVVYNALLGEYFQIMYL